MPKIKSGYNPAAWMLEVTSAVEESRLGVDFAEVYRRSTLFQYGSIHSFIFMQIPSVYLTRFTSFCFRRNLDLVETLSRPISNSKELSFPTKYSQSSFNQFLACLWKQNLSYWRNPQYTAVKFFYTVIISLMLGTICWRFGAKRFSTITFICILFVCLLHSKIFSLLFPCHLNKIVIMLRLFLLSTWLSSLLFSPFTEKPNKTYLMLWDPFMLLFFSLESPMPLPFNQLFQLSDLSHIEKELLDCILLYHLHLLRYSS